MPRIKMIIEYEGTNYHGFQRQANSHTIQEAIEKSLHKLTGENIVITGAGRTDAGVHALGQVIAFNSNSTIPPEKFHLALNSFLPVDIRVLESMEASADFNPRFHAVVKKYRYLFWRQKEMAAFYRNYAWCINETLDIEAMENACRLLEGRHDFSAFCASGSSSKTFTRTVNCCQLKQKGPFLIVEIEGDGFLYNMVRIIAGTLLEIGWGRIKAADIEIILASRDRTRAGPTAPPQGLYLVSVDYRQEL